jgi:hypothetical protein
MQVFDAKEPTLIISYFHQKVKHPRCRQMLVRFDKLAQCLVFLLDAHGTLYRASR